MDFRKAAQSIEEQVIQWRRYLHANPELSWQEHNTHSWLHEHLQEMGLAPRKIAGTGLLCDIAGDKSGPTIALRADIDALAVHEEAEVDYCSQKPGVMHACGHDAHTAMLLGSAKILSANPEWIAGTVRLLFQPAEETPPPGTKQLAQTGAIAMVDDGAMDGVEAVFGIHIFSYLPLGVVEVTPGPIMAGSHAFDIEITGKGGHAGVPQNTVDALAVAAHLVTALRSATTLSSDPVEPKVLHIGKLTAGEARTAVAEKATLNGTIRFLDMSVLREIQEKIEQVSNGIASAFGAQAKVHFVEAINKPVANHVGMSKKIRPIIAQVVGENGVVVRKPIMGAEDFWAYLEKAPGVFIGLGGGNPAKHESFGHHSPHFWIDEDALVKGVEIWLRIVAGAEKIIAS